MPEFYIKGTGFKHVMNNVSFRTVSVGYEEEKQEDYLQDYFQTEDVEDEIDKRRFIVTHIIESASFPSILRWTWPEQAETLCTLTQIEIRLAIDANGRKYALIYGNFAAAYKTQSIVQDIIVSFRDANEKVIESVLCGSKGNDRLRYFEFKCGAKNLLGSSVNIVTDPTLYCKSIHLNGRGGGWQAC
jgi:hypothetical protein